MILARNQRILMLTESLNHKIEITRVILDACLIDLLDLTYLELARTKEV